MPVKRKTATDLSPARKKGGFHLPDLSFTKQDFLQKAEDVEITLELKPKQMSTGGYGYQKSGGLMKVETSGALGGKTVYIRPCCTANVLGSKSADQGGMKTEAFLKKATPIKVTFECWPCEFSTGSFGWMAYRKQEVKVGDKVLMLQVNMNCPLDKSKEANTKEIDTALAEIDSKAALSKKHFDTIGVASGKKNDLTRIRGIGPWIEGRLNKIGICTFKQIANMTIDIQHDVNVAIKYFEGRVIRDEWTYQAQTMVKGDWEKLNPLFPRSGKGNYVTIDGVDYERKLIDLADHAMNDGVIEFWEAQALWWSANDDQEVTATEKKTLEYILKTKNLDDEAKTYLEQRIATV